jgi:indole-3-glycerol phosphate synthase
MTILDNIVAKKYREVKERKAISPVHQLEKSLLFIRKPLSLKHFLLKEDLFGIIAEFKRKSPSKGFMNEFSEAGRICCEYMQAGASAVSILTDSDFFGGSSYDLIQARELIDCPILRKDFIVDEYQIIEARSIGADAILLITSLHKPEKIDQFHRFARSLDLEVLVEVHDEEDFSKIPADAQLVGINSRNLSSLYIDKELPSRFIEKIPEGVLKIAESGIKTTSDYLNLKNVGFNGFLIGELFMNTPDPGKSCRIFIEELRRLGQSKGLFSPQIPPRRAF